MFVLVRALTYAALFTGVVLILLPARLLTWSGIVRPPEFGAMQAAGLAVTVVCCGIALWSVLAFITLGKGTPAPFDPPRRLVCRGPYRYVRNPMYIGAGGVLAGAALFCGSWPLAGYAAAFFILTHAFAVFYEEPVLRKMFGEEYTAYCRRVRRWLPRFRDAGNAS